MTNGREEGAAGASGLEYGFEEAATVSRRNGNSKWPTRQTANRLEPECWPGFTPSFSIPAGSSVFAIGSCFARNIEAYLARSGFDVPSLKILHHSTLAHDAGGEIVNKYTPPSIFQELAWTKKILDRDGQVTAEDIEPFLLELKDGKVMDLQRRFLDRYGFSRQQALEQRQLFFDLFSQAFRCETIVITLGLVECWWDNEVGQYIEWAPQLRDHDRGGRFVFRQLDYPECHDYTRRTIELLNGAGEKNILITTSPIPIARTFTSDDVIVANTYSKSVLRAVAGKIARDHPRVDYFPSFESVMLTRRPELWDDDLIHVDLDFIDRIMRRVVGAYVTGGGMSAEERLKDANSKLSTLLRRAQWDDIPAVLAEFDVLHAETPDAPLPFAYHLGAAACLIHEGRSEEARARLELMGEIIERPQPGDGRLDQLLAYAKLMAAIGETDRADALRLKAVEGMGDKPAWLKSRVHSLWIAQQAEDADFVMRYVERRYGENLDMLEFLADINVREGRLAEAERVLALAGEVAPDNAYIMGRRAGVLSQLARSDEARALLERMGPEIEKQPNLLRLLAAEYLKARRPADAEPLVRRLVELEPEPAHNHAMLARCYMQLGRRGEALAPARKAYELDADERYKDLVAQVEAAIARQAGKALGQRGVETAV